MDVTPDTSDMGWTTEQVIRITGASERRLGYWLNKGVLWADVDEARGRGRVRLWSFSNLIDVRVAMWLRDRVSLEVIANIISHVRSTHAEQSTDNVRFTVLDTGDADDSTHVLIRSKDADELAAALDGEVVMEIVVPMQRFVTEVREASANEGAKRRRLASAPESPPPPPQPLKPRVPASAIQALYYEGWPAQRIIDTFPGLTARDIQEALRAKRTK